MLTESAEKFLPEWSPVSPRIIMVRFNSRGRKVTIINRYALINNTAHGQKEEFYSFLQGRLNHSPRRGVKILLGKFNVQIGHDNAGKGGVARRYGLSCMKENGEQCTCFCPFSIFFAQNHSQHHVDDLSGWTNSVKPDRPYHDCQEVEDELERLKDALEKQVWGNQAGSTGFRKVKSCTAGPYCHPKDTRRTFLWMAEAIINDFEKAFNSVDRNVIWKLLHHYGQYGIPSKFIGWSRTFTNPHLVKSSTVRNCLNLSKWAQKSGKAACCTSVIFLMVAIVD